MFPLGNVGHKPGEFGAPDNASPHAGPRVSGLSGYALSLSFWVTPICSNFAIFVPGNCLNGNSPVQHLQHYKLRLLSFGEYIPSFPVDV